MIGKNVYIIKSDGTRELFDPAKLERSLRKIGTEKATTDMIVAEVQSNLQEGHTTREIYHQAFTILKKHQRPVAVRYSLKRAIADLGPSGFPFEKYISQIFKAQGYEAVTDQIVMGTCVPHEMDVVAWKKDELVMVEAKFHSDFAARSDLKVALYIKARFDDLKDGVFKYGGLERKLTRGMLITNTNFSTTAIQYGECAHLHMIGWNYPKNNNLHNMIENSNLVPLTALTTLTQVEKKMFLANDIILAKQLLTLDLLGSYGIPETRVKAIIKEVTELGATLNNTHEQIL